MSNQQSERQVQNGGTGRKQRIQQAPFFAVNGHFQPFNIKINRYKNFGTAARFV